MQDDDDKRQLGLFGDLPTPYESKQFGPVLDVDDSSMERADSQRARVLRYMSDGEVHTIMDVAFALGLNQNSTSARIRDLRKPKYGGYVIERTIHSRKPLVFGYRLIEEVPF